jgi:hypothetical protein
MWPTGRAVRDLLPHTWHHGIGDLMWELRLIDRVFETSRVPRPRQGEIILRR